MNTGLPVDQPVPLRGREQTDSLRFLKGCPDVDQRLGHRAVPAFRRAVQDRHLVIGVYAAMSEVVIDRADAAHPEPVQLGRPEGAHAGGTEHLHPDFQEDQDLLVRNRPLLMEVPVNDAHPVAAGW